MKSRTHTFQQSFIGKAIGLVALVVALSFLVKNWHDPLVAIASLFFIVICLTDTLKSKILNSSNLLMCLSGLTYQIYTNGTGGLISAGLGLLAGLALLIIPYILGGVGGGDIKALAALGTLVGPIEVFQIFIYIGLIGGVIAILHYLFALNREELKIRWVGWKTSLLALFCTKKPWLFMPSDPQSKLRFPYAAAITLGFFAFSTWGGLI
ncbi:MAG: prepilin peptidase [Desulfobulbaceae bacterium]|nr:prepilin peptidase [Desulfobulbaceae bacterium]